MLERLSIRDFAVARSVEVLPVPGLNVFTGETGAGKSLVVDALAFLFGARRGREVIATGSERAVVEATISVDGLSRVVERSISRAGRSSARIDGEPATVEQLADLGARAIDIHGQSDQLAILRPAVQLAALDAFGGLDGQRLKVTAAVRELRALRTELASLAASGLERERLLDQLRFEAEEIESAGLAPGEDEALHAERGRLGNVTRLAEDAAVAIAALESSALSDVASAVADIVARDPAASELAQAAATLESTGADLRKALRDYSETLEDDPERLAIIEERLDRIARLKRKYGATVGAILEYGQDAARRLAALNSSDERIAELDAAERELLVALAERAVALSRARRKAAELLTTELRGELEHLGMNTAALAVGFACEDDPAGISVGLPDYETTGSGAATDARAELNNRAFTESGIDRIEFLASFNIGESPRPLASVASGGETSRFLLALASVFSAAAEPRTVVFDEVDEGVGGRAGSVVGEALARLAARHQVFCITHLPQVAAYGARHFVVKKQSAEGGTWSDVEPVEGEQRLEEVAAMLGSVTEATRTTARELLLASQP